VFPYLSLIYPDSPHDVPQEFFIFQNPPLDETPTINTAWLIEAAQLLKIPE
jgi:hypothetical protein